MPLHIVEFQEPVPASILARYPHPARAQAFFSSRNALHHALLDLGLTPPPEVDVCPENPTQVPGLENVRVSLSHTKKIGGALVVWTHQHAGVGLDLEWEDRSPRAGSEKYFVNERDNHPLGTALWCSKEAAFKALYPYQKTFKLKFGRELLLKDIWVREGIFGLCQDMRGPKQSAAPLGKIILERRPWPHPNGPILLIAQAFLELELTLPITWGLE